MRMIIVGIMIIIFIILLNNNVLAYSCFPSPNKIGIVKEISTNKILLDDVKTFKLPFYIETINDYYDIDEYEKIVNEYIEGGLEEVSDRDYMSFYMNYSSIPIDITKKIDIKKGDIIIDGPPYSDTCSKSFKGIFISDGTMKYALIYEVDNEDFKYKNDKIDLNWGLLSFNGVNFSINLNESYSPKSDTIDSITLLKYHNYSGQFGLGSYISYLITFKNICPTIEKPQENENCSYTPIYNKDGNCLIKYEEQCKEKSGNIFKKIIDWIKSLFD